MPQANEVTSYTAVSKTLHWLIALLAFSQLAMGKLLEVDDAPFFAWHTSLGLSVLALMIARLAWRLTHGVPPPPAATPRWQSMAAAAMHVAFYVLLIMLPVSGWLLASAEGDAVTFLGWFDVPALPVPGGEDSEDLIEEVHEILGNVLLALAALHVMAGLKHHYVDHDNVLRRMMPGSG